VLHYPPLGTFGKLSPIAKSSHPDAVDILPTWVVKIVGDRQEIVNHFFLTFSGYRHVDTENT
jgi:hypothetical protein